MARVAVGRLGLAARAGAPGGLARYGATTRAGIAPIMQRSEQRLYEDVFAHTPVDTGHMQAHLLRTSDLAPVETAYTILWRDQEFTGEVNPRGQIIREFYPAKLILGGPEQAPKYPHLLTQETETERPRLVADLRTLFRGAA